MTRAQREVLEQLRHGAVLYHVDGYGYRLMPSPPDAGDPRPVRRDVATQLIRGGSVRRLRTSTGSARRYALVSEVSR